MNLHRGDRITRRATLEPTYALLLSTHPSTEKPN
jgi:hypothetical protein